MPFWVQNDAPSVFTRIMRQLLEPFKGRNLFNFINDLLIATEEWSEHMELLKTVTKRLREAGLTARSTKCHLGFPTIKYLGHTLSHGTLSPDQAKVVQVKNASRPVTKMEVRALLGLACYYRRYVLDFSTIAAPLTELTTKRAPDKVVWTDECELAFYRLKKALNTGTVLRLPDVERDFVLRTDASDNGLGAVLLQEHDGMLLPMAYGSKKLSPAEKHYTV